MIGENSNEFPAHKTTKTFSPNFHLRHSFALHGRPGQGQREPHIFMARTSDRTHDINHVSSNI